jgi:hypothetical protein
MRLRITLLSQKKTKSTYLKLYEEGYFQLPIRTPQNSNFLSNRAHSKFIDQANPFLEHYSWIHHLEPFFFALSEVWRHKFLSTRSASLLSQVLQLPLLILPIVVVKLNIIVKLVLRRFLFHNSCKSRHQHSPFQRLRHPDSESEVTIIHRIANISSVSLYLLCNRMIDQHIHGARKLKHDSHNDLYSFQSIELQIRSS